jgi:transmembrane sensor
MNNIDWNTIAKFLTHEPLDDSESQNLAQNGSEVEAGRETLKKVDTYLELKKFDAESAWEKVNDQTNSTLRKKIRFVLSRHSLRIAASLIVLLLGSFVAYQVLHKLNDQGIQTIVAEAQGMNKLVVLPDSSHVTLKPGSKLVYPKNFESNIRQVKLINGEAFFEVTPNQLAPFVIEAGRANVKVLGTSFNVKAYEHDNRIEVLVRTGKVELADAQAIGRKVLLSKGERGTFDIQNSELERQVGYDLNKLAWFTHEISFVNTKLTDVFEVLHHTFDVEFDLNEIQNPNDLLTARYKEQSLDYILNVIALTHNLSVEQTDAQHYRIQNKP